MADLLKEQHLFLSENVFINGTVKPAGILIQNGTIVEIIEKPDAAKFTDRSNIAVIDVGTRFITPGLIDTHVHVDEPGRTEWEGFWTATRAAAAGGITTIVDMPLNSIPATVSLDAFKQKLKSTEGKCFVNVGFWGGIIPGNMKELVPMLEAGVCGFKCFMIDSGLPEYPSVQTEDIEAAMKVLQGTDSVILFHAEVDGVKEQEPKQDSEANKRSHRSFLDTRPDTMEVEAIRIVCDLCLKYKVRCHIVHLSASSALPLIIDAREKGAPLTVETTHHYLTITDDVIPEGATHFKCCPPIRNKENQERLWQGVKDGHIDMVVSDHSPCTPDMKNVDTGDFLSAWGGIASLQFGLSLFWTHSVTRGLGVADLVRVMSENTASLAKLRHRKGEITPGFDADLVVWDPEAEWTVEEEMIQHKNKLTPFLGRTLKGVVHITVVNGAIVYHDETFSTDPKGKLLFRSP